MKILVVFTGGTIGSTLSDGWISPDQKTKYMLIDNYQRTHGDGVEFSYEEPYTILSENLSAEEINKLIECVGKSVHGDYDGIIVTHGTDTVQYSASALSYAFGDSPIPIVLVSSNYPLDDARSNGDRNFEAAVELIKSRSDGGVYVSYANDGDKVCIHDGNMLLCHGETDDKLLSLRDNVYAYYCDGSVIINPNHVKGKGNGTLGMYSLKPRPGVLVISSLPGDSFLYELNDCKAIILRPYHSATVNTVDEASRRFFADVRERKIPVFVVNGEDGHTYESVKEFDELGLIKLPLSTFVSAYVKAWIGVSRGEEIERFMLRPIAGEFYGVC
jgi:L-asparaginase